MSLWVCPECQAELSPDVTPSGTVRARCSRCGREVVPLEKTAGRPLKPAAERTSRSEPAVPREKRARADPGDDDSTVPRGPPRKAAPNRAETGRSDAGAEEPEDEPTRVRSTPAVRPPYVDPLIGTTIGGCEIRELLGSGGMGAVYKAWQLEIERFVALKTIRQDYVTDRHFLRRFRQEMRTVGRFKDSHVVHVYGAGEEGGIHYLIMEYVEGGDLKDYVQSKPDGQLPADDALRFLAQAAQGLLEAEKREIVHRDIKPANLLIDEEGNLKIADFGIAKVLRSSSQFTMTETGGIVGSPLYISPEQAEGAKLDHRSDMYSLGATFFHMLTAAPPVEGETLYEVIKKKSRVPSLNPRRIPAGGSIPESLAQVIERMTALRPHDRYPSFKDLLEDVERVRAGDRPEPIPAPKEPEEDERPPRETWARQIVALAKKPGVAALVALMALAGALYPLLFDGDPSPSPEEENGGPKVAAGDDPKRDDSKLAAGDDSKLAVGDDSKLAAGDDSKLAAGEGPKNGGAGREDAVSADSGGERATEETDAGSVPMDQDESPALPPAVSLEELTSRAEELKAQFAEKGPSPLLLEDARKLCSSLPSEDPEAAGLREQTRQLISDVDAARGRQDLLLANSVATATIEAPFDDLLAYWTRIRSILDPPEGAGSELSEWLSSQRVGLYEELKPKIGDALSRLSAEVQRKRKRLAAWDLDESSPPLVDKLRKSRSRLLEMFPDDREDWDRLVAESVISGFASDIARRKEILEKIDSLSASLDRLRLDFDGVKSSRDWTEGLANTSGEKIEDLAEGVSAIEKTDERAPLNAVKTRLEEVKTRQTNWRDHVGRVKDALSHFRNRRLGRVSATLEELAEDGISDPVIQDIRSACESMVQGFKRLFGGLDLKGAEEQFDAAETVLKGLSVLGDASSYPSKCKERLAELGEAIRRMAPVPQGQVRVSPDDPVKNVEGFFIDCREASVQEYVTFLEETKELSFEQVSHLWPDRRVFEAYRFGPAYLETEADDLDESWPVEEINYYQARAYLLRRNKDLPRLEEWWLAAKGPLAGGEHRIDNPNSRDARARNRPVRVDTGGIARAFPVSHTVHHLSGNVAEWCKADNPDATSSQLVGGRYRDDDERHFTGERRDRMPLRETRRGYGFRGVIRPRDFFGLLAPRTSGGPTESPGSE